MAYVAPSTVTTLQTYTSAAHNIIVNDIIDLDARVNSAKISTYAWSEWSPTNVTGTDTVAPATAASSYANATYVTQANSSGTLTITLNTAGYYEVAVTTKTRAANAFNQFRMGVSQGGTATRYLPVTTSDIALCAGESAYDNDASGSCVFLVSATASQTVTLKPHGDVNGAAGTASQYFFNAHCTVKFLGT